MPITSRGSHLRTHLHELVILVGYRSRTHGSGGYLREVRPAQSFWLRKTVLSHAAITAIRRSVLHLSWIQLCIQPVFIVVLTPVHHRQLAVTLTYLEWCISLTNTGHARRDHQPDTVIILGVAVGERAFQMS